MNLTEAIEKACVKAGFGPEFSRELKLADPKFGDLQLNGALPYAKATKGNPREIAAKFVEALEVDKTQIAVTVSGPGFVNFSFTPTALVKELHGINAAADLSPKSRVGQKVLMDFGSPNLGKALHVGHFRAYNIGSTVARLLEFCGAHLHRDNHVGDWGTMFGYIIYAIKKTGTQLDENDTNVVEVIESLYKQANAEAAADENVKVAARAETAKLQNGDPENIALWKKVVAANVKALIPTEKIFGVKYDTVLGESFYNDKVQRVYTELTELGIAHVEQGALVVFHPEHPRFKEQPFIIRKSDGAANYGSSDLAGMIYRVEVLGAEKIYIVTDARQMDHMEQLYLTTKKWFAAKGYKLPEFAHITHGAVLGDDNKPLKTRSGESVKLRDLFAEAVERARKVVEEKNPTLPDAEKASIAEAVGIGAIRYADLSQNRTSDYQFNWDKFLSFEGNTAPYMLYAIARMHSLFEKLSRSESDSFASVATLETPSEIALAKKLIQMPTIMALASAELRPHYLCTYLYELAGVFSSFYNSDHIQGESPDVVDRRLMLVAKTMLVLETGLGILGLTTLKRM